MTSTELYGNIMAKRSFLCVGLDPDMNKIPECCKSKEHPIFEFNKAIIDATAPYTVAFKPNCAFYEAYGLHGWQQFEMTVKYINENYPNILIIADAKRGDIGNTAKMYAKAFYENLPCHAVTIAPYMGSDSVSPFLSYPGKFAVVLAMTSNASAEELETLQVKNATSCSEGAPLHEVVIKNFIKLATADNLMFVVGATRPQKLKEIREYCPDNFLLVPGVGAQGGTIAEVAANGMNSRCGILVNSSRGIIYASSSEDFAQAAGRKAAEAAAEMANYLK